MRYLEKFETMSMDYGGKKYLLRMDHCIGKSKHLGSYHGYPDSKVHGANMGPIWGQQDPDGPHVGPMNLAIWVHIYKSQ